MESAALAADDLSALRKRADRLEWALLPYVEVAETLEDGFCPQADNIVWRIPINAPRHLWDRYGVRASHVQLAKTLLRTNPPANAEELRKRVRRLETVLQSFVDVSFAHQQWGKREGIVLWRAKWGSPGSIRVTWRHAQDAAAILPPSRELMAEVPEAVGD